MILAGCSGGGSTAGMANGGHIGGDLGFTTPVATPVVTPTGGQPVVVPPIITPPLQANALQTEYAVPNTTRRWRCGYAGPDGRFYFIAFGAPGTEQQLVSVDADVTGIIQTDIGIGTVDDNAVSPITIAGGTVLVAATNGRILRLSPGGGAAPDLYTLAWGNNGPGVPVGPPIHIVNIDTTGTVNPNFFAGAPAVPAQVGPPPVPAIPANPSADPFPTTFTGDVFAGNFIGVTTVPDIASPTGYRIYATTGGNTIFEIAYGGGAPVPDGAQTGGTVVDPRWTVSQRVGFDGQNAPGGAGITAIITTTDGSVWFTEKNSGLVGKIAPNGFITEFNYPFNQSTPIGIAEGPNGSIWFTQQGANMITALTSLGAKISSKLATTPNSGLWGICRGPDGNMWFTEYGANKVGRLQTTAPYNLTEWTLPMVNAKPTGILPATGRCLFACEAYNTVPVPAQGLGSHVGQVTVAGGANDGAILDLTFRRPSGQHVSPTNAVYDPTTGDYFVTEFFGNGIIRMSSADGTQTGAYYFGVGPFPDTAALVRPQSLVIGPDGKIWFTEQIAGKIGRIDTSLAGASLVEYTLPLVGGASPEPVNITVGPDGKIWFCEQRGDKIGRIDPAKLPADPTALTEVILPAGSWPMFVTAGPDNAMWFTEQQGNRIGRATTATVPALTEFTIPTANCLPSGIAAGTDGNLWFAEYRTGLIGRVTTAGTMLTELGGMAATSAPYALIKGSDGGMWFTELNANNIGRFDSTGTQLQEFAIPTRSSIPAGLSQGNGRTLLYTQADTEKIAIIRY